jgi:hypothetical protein
MPTTDPKITYNEVRDVIYDSAQFVTKLAGHDQQPGTIGVARTRRLIDSTLRLIRSLPADADPNYVRLPTCLARARRIFAAATRRATICLTCSVSSTT